MCVGGIGLHQESVQAAPGHREDLDLIAGFRRVHEKPPGAHLQGQALSLPLQGQGFARIYGPDTFLGLAEWKADGKLWAKRLIATGETSQGK